MESAPTPKAWKLVQTAGFVLILVGVVAASTGTIHLVTSGPLAVLGLLIWLAGRFGAWWQRG